MEAQINAILNTVRKEGESWQDVFTRLEPSGRVDFRASIRLLALILDHLENLPEKTVIREIPVEKPKPKAKPKKKTAKKKK